MDGKHLETEPQTGELPLRGALCATFPSTESSGAFGDIFNQ